jgi:hypothetical protein
MTTLNTDLDIIYPNSSTEKLSCVFTYHDVFVTITTFEKPYAIMVLAQVTVREAYHCNSEIHM